MKDNSYNPTILRLEIYGKYGKQEIAQQRANRAVTEDSLCIHFLANDNSETAEDGRLKRLDAPLMRHSLVPEHLLQSKITSSDFPSTFVSPFKFQWRLYDDMQNPLAWAARLPGKDLVPSLYVVLDVQWYYQFPKLNICRGFNTIQLTLSYRVGCQEVVFPVMERRALTCVHCPAPTLSCLLATFDSVLLRLLCNNIVRNLDQWPLYGPHLDEAHFTLTGHCQPPLNMDQLLPLAQPNGATITQLDLATFCVGNFLRKAHFRTGVMIGVSLSRNQTFGRIPF
ncbi:hypothetical protein EDC04DRAFT_2599279 [Pisolithus marmoratus]|nr:hypothetical protein EDC04DRAFT_2599279 [Pisolithus marmoratus]